MTWQYYLISRSRIKFCQNFLKKSIINLMLLMLQSELETNKILILVKMVSISPDEVALIVNSSSFFTNKEQNSYVSAVPSS